MPQTVNHFSNKQVPFDSALVEKCGSLPEIVAIPTGVDHVVATALYIKAAAAYHQCANRHNDLVDAYNKRLDEQEKEAP